MQTIKVMIGVLIKLSIEEIHNLNSSTNTVRMIKRRKMRWALHVVCMEKRNAYRILVGKPEGKRSLERPRHRYAS
jgi:hypothetical protein